MAVSAPIEQPDLTRWKIPPRPVPSDDCAVVIGRRIEGEEIVDEGTTYYPHAGETAWILPIGRTKAYLAFQRLFAPSNLDDTISKPEQADTQYHLMSLELAKLVVHWDWTDNERNPLPSPYNNPEVIEGLEVGEILWLMGAASGEAPSERKNGSGASPATSRAKARPRKR